MGTSPSGSLHALLMNGCSEITYQDLRIRARYLYHGNFGLKQEIEKAAKKCGHTLRGNWEGKPRTAKDRVKKCELCEFGRDVGCSLCNPWKEHCSFCNHCVNSCKEKCGSMA